MKTYIVAIRAKKTDVRKVLRNASPLKNYSHYLQNAAKELGYPRSKARKGNLEIFFMTEDDLQSLTPEMVAYYITAYDVDVTPLVAIDADVYYSIIKDVSQDDTVRHYEKVKTITKLILPHVKVVNKEQKTKRQVNPNARPRFVGPNPYYVGDLVFDTSWGHCYKVVKTTPKGYTIKEFDFDEEGNVVDPSHYKQRNTEFTVRFGKAKSWHPTLGHAVNREYNYTGMLPKGTLEECYENKQKWLNKVYWD